MLSREQIQKIRRLNLDNIAGSQRVGRIQQAEELNRLCDQAEAAIDLQAACKSAILWLLHEGYPDDNAQVIRCRSAIEKAEGIGQEPAELKTPEFPYK